VGVAALGRFGLRKLFGREDSAGLWNGRFEWVLFVTFTCVIAMDREVGSKLGVSSLEVLLKNFERFGAGC
jgi:hypothetical protein